MSYRDSFEATFLVRYDGTNFHEIALPAGFFAQKGQLEVLHDRLYMILRQPEHIPSTLSYRSALFRYDGTAFTEVTCPITSRKYSWLDKITTFQNKLHFAMYDTETTKTLWTTYDGDGTFTYVPWPEVHHSIGDIVEYRGKLYKLTRVANQLGEEVTRLLSYDGSTFSVLMRPQEESHDVSFGADLEVFNDQLYFLYWNTLNWRSGLVKFDLASFSYLETAIVPVPCARTASMKSFEGKMYLVSYCVDRTAGIYAFDGTSTVNVPLPYAVDNEPFLFTVYKCHLYCALIKSTEPTVYFTKFGPPESCSLFALPERVERVTIGAYAQKGNGAGRASTWTGRSTPSVRHSPASTLPL